jgi:hydrogenase nickel incorporation protein HypA/HybF
MHELSIAYNLVEIVENALIEKQITQVEVVHLRLGVLSGVVQDALLFGYDVATQGTRLAGSRLVIEEIPVVVFCPQCQRETILGSIQALVCPHCNQPAGDIRQGKEIEIDYLEVADEAEIA